jgi:hypothetical protein
MLFCLNVRIDSRILDISFVFKDTPQEKITLLEMWVRLMSAGFVPCRTVLLVAKE